MKNKILIFLLALFLLPFASGCDFVYRILQKEGAEEKDLIGEVNPYESNATVAQVQKLLKLYGYKVGKADGRLGANTRKAIKNFQEENNLKVTRFVDKATWQQLNGFTESRLVVDGEVNIKAVQTALKNAGFNPGSADGKWGRNTEATLKKFQRAMNLKDDGHIGYRTLVELKDFLPSGNGN